MFAVPCSKLATRSVFGNIQLFKYTFKHAIFSILRMYVASVFE